MSLPANFTEMDVDLVYELCNDYFKKGMEMGIKRVQADHRKIAGVPDFPVLPTLDEIVAAVLEKTKEVEEG